MPDFERQIIRLKRASILTFVGLSVLLGSVGFAAQVRAENTSSTLTVDVIPVMLGDQRVYPSRFASSPMTIWKVTRWQSVAFPESWVNKGYYVELWDGGNRPIPGFAARKLTQATLPLTSMDATLYPDVRAVLFQPASLPDLERIEPVVFSFSTQPNIRFGILLGMLLLLSGLLLLSIARYRIHPGVFFAHTRNALRVRQYDASIRTVATLFVLVMLWSALFGIVVGSFAGGIQILYVLVKLPLLLLSALLISGISLIVLLQLFGVRASAADILIFSLHVLTILAITLASLSPVLLLQIAERTNHDVMILWLLASCAIGGGMAMLRCWQFLRHSLARPLPALAAWVVLYGIVLLQLGWLLRPWVGVVDPIRKSLPFSRLYAGNVFTEVEKTFSRAVMP